MPRVSNKDNKSIFQQVREDLSLSRERASELLEGITPERLERIESGKFNAHPDEVVIMAEKYKYPYLCNYYCANCCEIGQQYVPEIDNRELSKIVLEMLSLFNGIRKKQETLIDISADGKIEDSEIENFIDIQNDLERISVAVEALKLWSEQMIANGAIDKDIYEEIKERKLREK